MTRSNKQIINQTNELARILYLQRSYLKQEGYRFDRATHPQEKEAWQAACIAQRLLTDTDPEDALEDEGL